MYKLIAVDIDGTLLNKDKAISPKTTSVFNAIPSHIPVVLISSRMPEAMRYLQRDLNIADKPIVAFNGGLVLNQNEILSHTGIDFNTFKTVLEQNEDLDLHLSLFHNDEWFAPVDDFWTQREIKNTKVNPVLKSNQEVFDLWKIHNKEPHKIMCMGEEAKVDEMFNRLLALEGNSLHLYRSKPTYIEMAPRQISKLSGLKVLLQKLYPKLELTDIIAYGDNYNDIEMLENVGMGVAVNNAKKEVKTIADEITQSNLEDGVAQHLEKIYQLKF
jgi:Cof subfamily protein (haloacid dehalogenase superfamily)